MQSNIFWTVYVNESHVTAVSCLYNIVTSFFNWVDLFRFTKIFQPEKSKIKKHENRTHKKNTPNICSFNYQIVVTLIVAVTFVKWMFLENWYESNDNLIARNENCFLAIRICAQKYPNLQRFFSTIRLHIRVKKRFKGNERVQTRNRNGTKLWF